MNRFLPLALILLAPSVTAWPQVLEARPLAPRAQVRPSDAAGARQSRLDRELLEAAAEGYGGVMEGPLQAGANVDARNAAGETPLMIVLQNAQILTEDENRKRARLLLEHGADVNARDNQGNSPLMLAAASESGSDGTGAATLKLLLDHGAQVNARNLRGETALFLAISENLKPLLEAGADANARNALGETPLMFRSAYPDDTRLLLKRGAQVDARDDAGQTALMHSSGERMQLLLQAGADPNAQDKAGQTALMKAIATLNNPSQDSDITRLLAHGARMGTRNRRGETAFAVAARHPSAAILRLLAGRSTSAQDRASLSRGLLSLQMIRAASAGDAVRVKYLLGRGASVDAVVSEEGPDRSYEPGDTALLAAASAMRYQDEGPTDERRKFRGSVAVARVLLARGARVSVQNTSSVSGERGDFPLLRAIGNGNEPLARLLLRHGALGNEGYTPLMASVYFPAITRMLLARGARAEVHSSSNSYSRTALALAAGFGRTESVRLLLRHGARLNARDGQGLTPLMLAIDMSHDGQSSPEAEIASSIAVLLRAGADPNARDLEGRTPLMLAAIDDPEWVLPLLGRGARPNDSDGEGMTPLMHAASAHFYGRSAAGSNVSPPWPRAVRLLLARGARPNARDKNGRTALMHAVNFAYLSSYIGGPHPRSSFMPRLHAATQAVRLLLAGGSDPQLRDNSGHTPLQWARARGYSGMERLLKQAAQGPSRKAAG